LIGAILAGGKATRYGGQAKGMALVGGVPIAVRVRDALIAATGVNPVLIANDPTAGSWLPGLRIEPDIEPGVGALGGLLTAVVKGPAPVLCVAWDMPFVPAGLLRDLASGLQLGYDAFLPASEGPRGFEPICAAYGPACADAIRAALARGEREAVAFHQAIKVGILPVADVRRYGDPRRLFLNVNSPDDQQKADALWRESSPSSD
jgi:molybdopterin-guanine dinucleotide biosynthesis protein A